MLTQMIRLGIVTLKDYIKFLKITVSNPAMWERRAADRQILLLDHSRLAAGE